MRANIGKAAGIAAVALAAASLAACGGGRSYTFSGGAGLAGPSGSQGPAGPAGPAGADGQVSDLVDPLGRVVVGDQSLGADGPLGVSVLAPGQAEGDAATLGVLSDGQLVTLGSGDGSTARTSDGQPTQLLGVGLGDRQVLGDQNGRAVIDLGVLSPDPARGTGVTGNVLSGGQPIGVGLGGQGGNGQPRGQNGLGGLGDALGGLLGRPGRD